MMPDKDDAKDGQGMVPPSGDTSGHMPVYSTFSQLVDGLENGDLGQELTEQLRTITQELVDYAKGYGGKPKGKLTLVLDFRHEDQVIYIEGGITTKVPQPPRGRSIVWPMRDGRVSPANPAQQDMFRQGPVKAV